jgi:hypothetical protein
MTELSANEAPDDASRQLCLQFVLADTAADDWVSDRFLWCAERLLAAEPLDLVSACQAIESLGRTGQPALVKRRVDHLCEFVELELRTRLGRSTLIGQLNYMACEALVQNNHALHQREAIQGHIDGFRGLLLAARVVEVGGRDLLP